MSAPGIYCTTARFATRATRYRRFDRDSATSLPGLAGRRRFRSEVLSAQSAHRPPEGQAMDNRVNTKVLMIGHGPPCYIPSCSFSAGGA